MSRQAALTVLCAMALVPAGEGSQQPASRGLVIEAVEKGSAAELTGLKAGDELISWTRSAGQGEFRTPFDARAFELEQLPRGGTMVVAQRNGKAVQAMLIPGFWGVAVRPAFTASELAIYDAGVAQLAKQPSVALATWQPLLDRLSAGGDQATAAWLMTRAAASQSVLNQLDSAAELFDRAAASLRDQSNAVLEAMVWEAKGFANHPENPRPGDPPLTRQRIEAAIEAHVRASSIRTQFAWKLAAAESESTAGYAGAVGVGRRFLPDTSEEEKAAFQRSGVRIRSALDVVAALAPRSFAHARALFRSSYFAAQNWGPRSSTAITQPEASRARLDVLREARRIFEEAAPAHSLMKEVLSISAALVSDQNDQALLEREEITRAQIRFGVLTADLAFLETGTRNLASVLMLRDRLPEAMALVDGRRRAGSTPAAISLLVRSIARVASDEGAVGDGIRILEEHLRTDALPADAEIGVINDLVDRYQETGNLGAAETVLLRAVDRIEAGDVPPLQQASVFQRLAEVAGGRGNLETAESLAARGTAILEGIANSRPDLIRLYNFRAMVAEARGHLDAARTFLEKTIELQGPNPVAAAQANIAHARARLAAINDDREAELEARRQELVLRRQSRPGSDFEIQALHNLGTTHLERDEYDVALPYLRDAAALCRRIQPGTPFLAYELGLLGMAEGAVGNRQEGLRLLKEALAITEQLYQRPSAGGWGDGAEAGVPDVHFNYADLLIKDGQPEAAFDVVEKARARAMLNLLAARAQRDSAAVPEALRRERRRREIELDQKRAQIAALSTATDGQAIEAATIELNEIQMRLGDVVRRIAEADPRAAALERPSPLTLADARSRLDAGTVLLSYFVGAKETLLFVVTPPATTPAGGPGLTVHRLPATASELQDSVEAFSRLIEWETDPAQANRPARIGRGRELYALLIRPAENSIAAAERVLINPDGPLYGLPFGALQRDTAKGPQHLIAWKPLHTTMSMSVYAEVLRSRREHSGPGQIVAFGDPKYPAPAFKPADADLALLQRNGVNLAPLRGARREVTEIGRIFGAHAVTFLGEAATEARARSLGRSPRYIHFAAHAILSESQPLDSALVLTIPESPRPGEPNGILQTWEIFEHLRIDADLVTLSACETGLGRIFAGEGLVGLTRAFLYAGARTVAASLWKVGDGPTAELMTHFYTNLRRGLTKDEALRQAQLALIDKRSSPAHWAAFMLTGDWK